MLLLLFLILLWLGSLGWSEGHYSGVTVSIPVIHRPIRVDLLALSSGRGGASIPINGSVADYAEFFVEFSLGTPPQVLYAQLDTGSTDLLLYGTSCTSCPAAATRYNPRSSSTSRIIPCLDLNYQCDPGACYNNTFCGFDDGYGDGSEVKGYVIEDVFTIGALSAANVSFGSIQRSSSNFEPTGVDGIFGLAWPSTSSWAADSALTVLMNQQKLYPAFSLCLKPTGGSLTLGVNTHTDPRFEFSPAAFHKVYFTVKLNDVIVGSSSIGVDSVTLNGAYGALVDSGTTLMIFPTTVMNAIETHFKLQCNSYPLPGVCTSSPETLFNGYCFPMNTTDIAHFPPFSISIVGLSNPLTVSPSTYLIPIDQYSCLGIESIDAPITILGDTFMGQFNVVFDMESQEVGFADGSTCP